MHVRFMCVYVYYVMYITCVIADSCFEIPKKFIFEFTYTPDDDERIKCICIDVVLTENVRKCVLKRFLFNVPRYVPQKRNHLDFTG